MLQVIQRPNVFCSEIQIIHLVADERPAVIVHFINQGGTPALSVKLSAGLEFVTDQKQLSAWFPQLSTQGEFTVAAGSKTFLTIAYPRKLSKADIDDLLHSAKELWVFGGIEYFDPVNDRTVQTGYTARYIVFGPDWPHRRPDFPSDFWIFNSSIGR